jgi:hypothetical protein
MRDEDLQSRNRDVCDPIWSGVAMPLSAYCVTDDIMARLESYRRTLIGIACVEGQQGTSSRFVIDTANYTRGIVEGIFWTRLKASLYRNYFAKFMPICSSACVLQHSPSYFVQRMPHTDTHIFLTVYRMMQEEPTMLPQSQRRRRCRSIAYEREPSKQAKEVTSGAYF